MTKRSDEKKVLQEIIDESIEELKEPEPDGKLQGYVGILIGFIGLFMPLQFAPLAGIITITLGIYANKHRQRKLGRICSIIGLIDMSYFLLFMGGRTIF